MLDVPGVRRAGVPYAILLSIGNAQPRWRRMDVAASAKTPWAQDQSREPFCVDLVPRLRCTGSLRESPTQWVGSSRLRNARRDNRGLHPSSVQMHDPCGETTNLRNMAQAHRGQEIALNVLAAIRGALKRKPALSTARCHAFDRCARSRRRKMPNRSREDRPQFCVQT